MTDEDTDNKIDTAANHWRLDRRIPIAPMLALFCTVGGGIYWMGQLSQRVAEVEQSVFSLKTRADTAATLASSVDSKLARIEAQLEILIARMQAQDKSQ
ncbi:MAG TPA: hypothetical protein PLD10_13655 [Rhodopila sp.]|nr:hypothetical protein [Rhodopila sp.]